MRPPRRDGPADPPGEELQRQGTATSSPCATSRTAPARRSRPEGFPLLPRRATCPQTGRDQQATAALRAGLQGPAPAGHRAQRILSSPGTSPSVERPRTSPPGCSASATTPSPSSATPTSPTGRSPAHGSDVHHRPARPQSRVRPRPARVTGTFTVPCYMTSTAERRRPARPGSAYNLLQAANAEAERHLERANSLSHSPQCHRSTTRDARRPVDLRPRPARRRRRGQRRRRSAASPRHDMMHCATDEIGFAAADVGSDAVAILRTSRTPRPLAERVQQGLAERALPGPSDGHPGGSASVRPST